VSGRNPLSATMSPFGSYDAGTLPASPHTAAPTALWLPPPQPAATSPAHRADAHRRTSRTLTGAESYTYEKASQPARNCAAIFSATASVLRFVFARGIVGMTDASATYRFS